MPDAPHSPSGWPAELLPVFQRSMTVEYASLTSAGKPITYPCTPYLGDDGRTLDVSTGLAYPTKAERARRNPRVALLYADPLGSGLVDPPVVLVRGLATVRDRDLQWTTDRYIRLSMAKTPAAFARQPKPLLRSLVFYFSRIWVQVTPIHMLWWPAGNLDQAPHEWRAPADTTAPPSDPPPRGKQPPPWREGPGEWRPTAQRAVQDMPFRDVTVVDSEGFPLCMPVAAVEEHPAGFRLRFAGGLPPVTGGPACFTFHAHAESLTSQENKVFVGEIEPTEEGATMRVERLLGDWSVPASPLRRALDFLVLRRRQLQPRLRSEAQRRGQSLPKIRFPGEY